MSVTNDTDCENSESRGNGKGEWDLGAWDRTELERGDTDKVQLLLSGRGNEDCLGIRAVQNKGAQLRMIAGAPSCCKIRLLIHIGSMAGTFC